MYSLIEKKTHTISCEHEYPYSGWLPEHRDQLRAERSVISIEELYLILSYIQYVSSDYNVNKFLTIILSQSINQWVYLYWHSTVQHTCDILHDYVNITLSNLHQGRKSWHTSLTGARQNYGQQTKYMGCKIKTTTLYATFKSQGLLSVVRYFSNYEWLM